MENIELKEIQKLEFNILKCFKKYCDKNNLKFMLIGGTLLGAVRHKGFIPWDDDIDVGMFRKDYNELIKLISKNPYIDSKKRYKVLLPLDKNHIYPYIKIIDTNTIAYEKYINKKYATGLWLDVFPYDYAADTKEEIRKTNKKQKFYKTFFKVGVSGELPLKKKLLKIVAYPAYKILTRKDYTYWTKKILSLPTAYPTKYVGDVVWLAGEKDMFPVEWFRTTVKLTFEGEKFDCPVDYDKYLTQFYGNYMKIPDEKDRVMHDFECYYIENKNKKE